MEFCQFGKISLCTYWQLRPCYALAGVLMWVLRLMCNHVSICNLKICRIKGETQFKGLSRHASVSSFHARLAKFLRFTETITPPPLPTALQRNKCHDCDQAQLNIPFFFQFSMPTLTLSHDAVHFPSFLLQSIWEVSTSSEIGLIHFFRIIMPGRQ